MPQIVAPGSALGEAVGKLIERDIFNVVGKIAKSHGFTVSSETLRNKGGSEHSIDIVVKDQKGEPVVLVEPKYLRLSLIHI